MPSIDTLSVDYPAFLSRLKYMRSFAEADPKPGFMQQVAAQIPWFYNCVILDRLSQRADREWYIHKTIANGWSRNLESMRSIVHEQR